MSTKAVPHPSRLELRMHRLGLLKGELRASVADHYARCGRCQALAHWLPAEDARQIFDELWAPLIRSADGTARYSQGQLDAMFDRFVRPEASTQGRRPPSAVIAAARGWVANFRLLAQPWRLALSPLRAAVDATEVTATNRIAEPALDLEPRLSADSVEVEVPTEYRGHTWELFCELFGHRRYVDSGTVPDDLMVRVPLSVFESVDPADLRDTEFELSILAD